MPELTQFSELISHFQSRSPKIDGSAPSAPRLMALLHLPEQAAVLTRLLNRAAVHRQIHNLRGNRVPDPEEAVWLNTTLFPVTARWIRDCYHAPTPLEVRFELIRELLGYYAVEVVENKHGEVLYEYLNAGDPYVDTLYRSNRSTHLQIGCLADLVERAER